MDINKVFNLDIFSSLFSSIEKFNKYFTIPEGSDVYVVNNKHKISGVIVINHSNDILNVSIYQPPGVCRISILMLIEASVWLSKFKYSNYSLVTYNTYLEAYKFKYRSILKEYEEDELSITVNDTVVKELSLTDITKRSITYDGSDV